MRTVNAGSLRAALAVPLPWKAVRSPRRFGDAALLAVPVGTADWLGAACPGPVAAAGGTGAWPLLGPVRLDWVEWLCGGLVPGRCPVPAARATPPPLRAASTMAAFAVASLASARCRVERLV